MQKDQRIVLLWRKGTRGRVVDEKHEREGSEKMGETRKSTLVTVGQAQLAGAPGSGYFK